MSILEQNLETILKKDQCMDYELDYLGLFEYSDGFELKKDLTITEKQIINNLLKEYGFEKHFEVPDIENKLLMYKYVYDWSNKIIEDYKLNFGNAQVLFVVKETFYNIDQILKNNYDVEEFHLTLEAPNHSLLKSNFKLSEYPFIEENQNSIIDYLYQMIDHLYEKFEYTLEDATCALNVDTEFERRWSKESKIKPTQLIKMLKEDVRYFDDLYYRI